MILDALGSYFPDIMNGTDCLIKHSVEYAKKEPTKSLIMIGAISGLAYGLFKTFSSNEKQDPTPLINQDRVVSSNSKGTPFFSFL